MRKEDLMIGDWVFSELSQQAEKVQEIGSGLVMLDANDVYEYDEIKPIPLTEEILKKNGFVQDGESFWYKDIRIVLCNSRGGSLVCGRQIKFCYVHQLQHALRLCRVDKDILL